MLNIGNKVYRNLQEQVAYNTECIKKLDEYLDGVTIEDKLVVIENDSGTFTDEELVILSGPLAFISNGSRVWMKDSETLVQFVFKAIDIVSTEVGSAYCNVGGSKIVVNREDGSYNTSSDTIISVYNKSQMDSIVANIMAVKANVSDVYPKTQTYSQAEVGSLLALKADLAGANFTGPITAPNITENMSGYSFHGVASTEDHTVDYVYWSAVKNGNKLTLVWFFDLSYIAGGGEFSVGRFKIPDELMAKIYPIPFSGNTAVDFKSVQALSSVNSATSLNVSIRKYSNGITLFVMNANSLTANTHYMVRVEETFLLNDSLVS